LPEKKERSVIFFHFSFVEESPFVFLSVFFQSCNSESLLGLSPSLSFSLSHICFSCLYLFCLLITRNNNSVIKFYSFDKENKVGKGRTSINIVNEAVGHVNIDLKTKVTIQVF